MKVLYLSNNPVSSSLFAWLGEQREITELLHCETKLTAMIMETLEPDIVVSYSYRYIISADVLSMLPGRFINLHISLLPYNRGADPNVWSFLEDTPKGVSIHQIDPGIDTGPILLQREVSFDEDVATLADSYSYLHLQIQELFRENWRAIAGGAISPTPQQIEGTVHFSKEFRSIQGEILGETGWDTKVADCKQRYMALRLRQIPTSGTKADR